MTEPVSEAVELLRFGAIERLPKIASWLEERMHFNEAKDVRSAVAALTAFAAREDELRRELTAAKAYIGHGDLDADAENYALTRRAEEAEARIAQAVADEREACAKVAESAIQHIARQPHSPDIDAGGLRAAEHIASAIRSRALLQREKQP